MVAIAAVLDGSFHYSADSGKALLHPGALMLGNPGSCYQCGHDHSTGDRCAALHLAPELFAEIAASSGGGARFRFTSAMLPALPDVTRPMVELLAARENAQREAAVIALAEKVVSILSGKAPSVAAPNARDHRRIDRVLRHIEAHADEALDLDALAGIACMSKYHFLRCFRRITGVTPYDFLLRLRLRRAALKLSETPAPVSDIAYDSGFGDLSTFNHRFRGTFGEVRAASGRASGRRIAAQPAEQQHVARLAIEPQAIAAQPAFLGQIQAAQQRDPGDILRVQPGSQAIEQQGLEGIGHYAACCGTHMALAALFRQHEAIKRSPAVQRLNAAQADPAEPGLARIGCDQPEQAGALAGFVEQGFGNLWLYAELAGIAGAQGPQGHALSLEQRRGHAYSPWPSNCPPRRAASNNAMKAPKPSIR